MSTPAQRPLARHGLLVVALLAGMGLLATAWSSRQGAEALADTVNEGQAELLLRALRDTAPPRRRPAGEPGPSDSDLRRLFDQHHDDGLRGVGLVDPETLEVRTVAGLLAPQPVTRADLDAGRHVRRVGHLLRIHAPLGPGGRPGPEGRPPPARGDGPGSGPLPEGDPNTDRANGPGGGPLPEGEPHPDRANGPGGGPADGPDPADPASLRPAGRPPPRVVLEVEPLFADRLIARAERTLAIAALAAAALVAAAALLWRRAVRDDALAARLARSEHLASLGTMSAVLAHEIKNPLAALKGNAQLVAEALAAEPHDARPHAQAQRVVDAAVRLQTLVTNLLDFARGEPLTRVATDPAELLFLAACEAAPRATLALDAGPATFSLDPVRMTQVLENLLRNAEQASPDSVTAELGLRGAHLVIAVRDSGPGFERAPESYFEPFTTTKARGTGLGLAVARHVVEQHGGTIRARNRPEGGAEVVIEIPP